MTPAYLANIKLCSEFSVLEGRRVDDASYEDLNVKFDRIKQF